MKKGFRAGRTRSVYVVMAMACLVAASGCLHRGFHARGLEPQARMIEERKYRVIGESEGTSSSFNLLWVIPVTPRLSFDRAVNEAISARGGDNLIEVRSWTERQVWIVGMVEVLHVKGMVIQYEK